VNREIEYGSKADERVSRGESAAAWARRRREVVVGVGLHMPAHVSSSFSYRRLSLCSFSSQEHVDDDGKNMCFFECVGVEMQRVMRVTTEAATEYEATGNANERALVGVVRPRALVACSAVGVARRLLSSASSIAEVARALRCAMNAYMLPFERLERGEPASRPHVVAVARLLGVRVRVRHACADGVDRVTMLDVDDDDDNDGGACDAAVLRLRLESEHYTVDGDDDDDCLEATECACSLRGGGEQEVLPAIEEARQTGARELRVCSNVVCVSVSPLVM